MDDDIDSWSGQLLSVCPSETGASPGNIGSIRREVLNHVIVFGERHLRQVLSSYLTYHNEARTHLPLGKDAPVPRAVQGVGRIFAKLHLGGLHHQYIRI